MGNPELLLVDEPTEGLAPMIVEQVERILGEIHRSGTPVLLVEQSMETALALAQRVYVMSKGQIVFSGTHAGAAGRANGAEAVPRGVRRAPRQAANDRQKSEPPAVPQGRGGRGGGGRRGRSSSRGRAGRRPVRSRSACSSRLSGPVTYIGEGNVAGFRFGAERVNAAGGVLGARSRSCRRQRAQARCRHPARQRPAAEREGGLPGGGHGLQHRQSRLPGGQPEPRRSSSRRAPRPRS